MQDEEVRTEMLNEKQLKTISEGAEDIKKNNPSVKRVIPIVVMGDEYDEKSYFVAYFKRPGIVAFSKYMQLIQKDSVKATKELAKDCYLGGDKELVDDDELFIYGLMPQLANIIKTKDSEIVNLSKAGK